MKKEKKTQKYWFDLYNNSYIQSIMISETYRRNDGGSIGDWFSGPSTIKNGQLKRKYKNDMCFLLLKCCILLS